MIPGIRGRLVTASFARDVLPTMAGFAPVPPHVSAQLRKWALRLEAMLGPASSVRAIADVAVVPLFDLLGFESGARSDRAAVSTLRLTDQRDTVVSGVVIGWSEPLDRGWRAAVSGAIAADARWCFCCNGRALRLVDARRTWSRAYLEFDLVELGHEREAQIVLWALARAEAMAGTSSVIDCAVARSDQHGVAVCKALGTGVLEALETLVGALARGKPLDVARGKRGRPQQLLFEQSLTVVYRVLFLLFAEARGLVPTWHPIYRDRYSLDAIVATLLTGQSSRGLWHTVRAISRLAHTGYSVGELHVTAFNGRLFAPAQSDAFDGTPLSDAVMARAVMAVSTTPLNRHGGRARIVYRDLDVEQLGAVYERVLDYEPSSSGGRPFTRTGDLRKASGTFYTPRSVAAFLVRQTLEPLIRHRTADEILSLRVLDPAMGSGAFLVAACRFLSAAAEEALVEEGRWHAHEITAADRVHLRRTIASRCLYGVDLNPMAVQLARLSIWLATLAADKPLSFLDHHLQVGNSLIGASPDDVWRYRAARTKQTTRDELPLFDRAGLTSAVEHAVRLRLRVTTESDDTAAIVRAKEQTLASLLTDDSSLRAWVRVLDLWCATWFWREERPPDRGVFRELASHLLGRECALSPRMASALLANAHEVATAQRFFHWPLAFPEVFVDERGGPLCTPGFDAIVGNPPWEMVRGDSGDDDRRRRRRLDARQVTDFVRGSGIYHVDARAHANLYQWFVERALQLVRPGGRVGFVLPFGIASDSGTAPLRRYLFDRAEVDSLTVLDNRDAIFPIHRSVRFALLTCTNGRPTTSIACRFGITRLEALENDASSPERRAIAMTRAFLARLSGEDDLGVPDLSHRQDLAIVERIAATVPRLGATDGWHVRFGRELNASDDRDLFEPCTGDTDARRVVEGKQIEPFRVALDRCRLQVRREAVARAAVPHRARLAYRDVASATNRLTLIAAIVPPRAVTTHTLFCLKTKMAAAEQHVLCALLNSFVANYLVRLRVNTHVAVALVSKLFVPVIREGHPLFAGLLSRAEWLTRASMTVEDAPQYAELQALVAHAYGLRRDEFEHVLSTFPLIAESVRNASIRSW